MKLTKIICTIGPSSNNEVIIKQMRQEGMDVVRLNFSHGNSEEHKKTFEMIRSLDESIPIAIDISGPKIRLKEIPHPTDLFDGEKIILTTKNTVDLSKKVFPVNYPKLPTEVKEGSKIFIDDGFIELKVEKVIGQDIYCEVIDGGAISSKKGINVPDADLSLHVPTPKDIKDIEQACDLEADFIFVSFVRDVNDLKSIKEIMLSKTKESIPLISKIEHIDGVRNINAILNESEGLMVARGDLAIEVGPAKVPVLQKQLINLGIAHAKPVIVATQMLESMRYEPLPSRAEASDVAHAVFDHADALMLSGETASGKFPVEAVRTMKRIILEAENMLRTTPYSPLTSVLRSNLKDTIATVIAGAATQIASRVQSKAIVALTSTGFSARVLSQNRFPLPILAVTSNTATFKKIQIYWGVHPIKHRYTNDFNQLLYEIIEMLHTNEYIGANDRLVFVHGSILGIPGKTNTIQVVNASEILAGKH